MNRTLCLCVLCSLISMTGRAASDEDVLKKVKLAPPSTWKGDTLFELVPSEKGQSNSR